MADAKLDPALVLQPGTAENYDEMARDIAKTEGISPKAAMGKLAAGFRQNHENDKLGGWNYLADWADSRDPGDGGEVNSEAFEIFRAVESAKREPKLALQSHPDAVDAALETLQDREDVSREKPDGTVPNSGPAKLSGKSATPSNANVAPGKAASK